MLKTNPLPFEAEGQKLKKKTLLWLSNLQDYQKSFANKS